MTEPTNHIRRVTIDFQFNGKTDGFSFQQEVRDWFDEFVAELDEEFKELSPAEQVIQIESLELEVSLDGRDWREQASSKIIRQLKDRIRLMRAGEISNTGLKVTAKSQQFEDCFLHYLEYGYLPWPSSGLSSVQWNAELELLIINIKPIFRNELKRILARSNSALQRFSQLVPIESALQLIQGEQSYLSPYLEDFIRDFTALLKKDVFSHDPIFKQLFCMALMASGSNDQAIVKIEQEVLAALQQAFSDQSKLKERFMKISFRSPGFTALKKFAARSSDSTKNRKEEPGVGKNAEDVKKSLLLDKVSTEGVTSEEPIFIANAGLVIVAPFLPGLLERLKLALSDFILDEAKAIGVTHFLATGNDTIQEYELPFAKVLCGIPVQKPVDVSSFRVSKKIRSEVENVLASVIEHWSILGTTSTSGLRESFLKRNGKLHFDGHDWILQVEQQPYDMLLQHLPWTISMLKLPWMPHMLKTDWVY